VALAKKREWEKSREKEEIPKALSGEKDSFPQIPSG